MTGVLSAWYKRDVVRSRFDVTHQPSFTRFEICLTYDVVPANTPYERVVEFEPPFASYSYARATYELFAGVGDWWTMDPLEAYASNTYKINFPTVTGTGWGEALVGYAIVTANPQNGAARQLVATGRFPGVSYRFVAGQTPVIGPGGIRIGLD